MAGVLWWIKIILIGVCSVLFLAFGIGTLIGGYHLDNPLQFIMVFFAASLMILISLVGVLYPFFQVHARFKGGAE